MHLNTKYRNEIDGSICVISEQKEGEHARREGAFAQYFAYLMTGSGVLMGVCDYNAPYNDESISALSMSPSAMMLEREPGAWESLLVDAANGDVHVIDESAEPEAHLVIDEWLLMEPENSYAIDDMERIDSSFLARFAGTIDV